MNENFSNLLSICMPTYNRVETLRITLPDLISKISHYKIKIFISDNNSEDDTEEYILELKKIYPYITYSKSAHNIGSDRNMERALKISDSKYRFLLSDHYILYDNTSIDTILNYLTNGNEFDALILHYKNRKMFRDQDYIYIERNLFLEELGWYIGMAATTVYNSDIIERFDFNRFFDTEFAQAMVLLDYLSKYDFKIQYVAKDSVWNMKEGLKGSRSWHHNALRIFTQQWFKSIISLSDKYSLQSKYACIKNHSKMTIGFYSFKSLLLYRFTKGLTFLKVIKYIKYLYFCAGIKTVFSSLLLSLMPISFIKHTFKKDFQYTRNVLGNMNEYKDKLL